jgi:alkylated DNA repair dioxygenase AlkB
MNDIKELLYIKNFITMDIAKKYKDIFERNVHWTQDRYILYGREVFSPRLTAFYSSNNKKYTYSGQTKLSRPYNKLFFEIAMNIEKKLNLPLNYLNGCLLNLYRNGNDSISYHTDKEKDMSQDSIVAVISLGSERNFCIKNIETGEVKKIKLEEGSLVVMYPEFQNKYLHAILKEKKINTSRISLTFRNFK